MADLAALAAHLHFGVVDRLLHDVFVAVAHAEAAFGVVVGVLLAILTANIPLALLRLPHRLVIRRIREVPRALLQLPVYPDLVNL